MGQICISEGSALIFLTKKKEQKFHNEVLYNVMNIIIMMDMLILYNIMCEYVREALFLKMIVKCLKEKVFLKLFNRITF